MDQSVLRLPREHPLPAWRRRRRRRRRRARGGSGAPPIGWAGQAHPAWQPAQGHAAGSLFTHPWATPLLRGLGMNGTAADDTVLPGWADARAPALWAAGPAGPAEICILAVVARCQLIGRPSTSGCSAAHESSNLLAGIATGEAMCTPNAQRSTDGDAQVDADPSLKAAIPAGRDRCAFQTLPVRWQLRRTALDC
jgi:hypothetical protein